MSTVKNISRTTRNCYYWHSILNAVILINHIATCYRHNTHTHLSNLYTTQCKTHLQLSSQQSQLIIVLDRK